MIVFEQRIRNLVYFGAIIVNVFPAFLHRLFYGELHGDENLVYEVFVVAVIFAILIYLPFIRTSKDTALLKFLFMPSVLHFIIGTLGIISQIAEDGILQMGSIVYGYSYFLINLIYAFGVYRWASVHR